MKPQTIDNAILATLSALFAELSKSPQITSFALRERFGRGANLDIETQLDGQARVVSVNVFPSLLSDVIVLQIDDQQFHLFGSTDRLSRDVKSALQQSRLSQILPGSTIAPSITV